MRIGFALPQVGSAVGPETLVTAAKRAEDLGFDSLWVSTASSGRLVRAHRIPSVMALYRLSIRTCWTLWRR